ncbi:MAG: MarR family winged helix-turn-helix transcriptional regulator [Chloroflexota bacterium]
MTSEAVDVRNQVWEQINALSSYRRRLFCSHQMHREVSLPQMYVLISLQDCGETTVSELAALLQISAPSTSSILDRMEEHQVIERSRDAVDRRVVHVRITERGRVLVEEMMGLQREHLNRLLEAMTDDEARDVLLGAAAIRRVLGRMPENLPVQKPTL